MKRLLSVLFAFSVSQTLTAAPSRTSAAAIADTFKAPVISLTWIYDTAKSVKITVQDSSNGETGFLVYRADSLSAPFKMVAQAVSANPLTQDSVFIYDSTMAVNSWNIYKVAAYRSGDTLISAPCTTYIYKDLGSRQTIKFTKVGNFAVTDTIGGWSALVGDSIYLKEATTPAGKFTVINVSNPAAPVRGAIDSTVLLTYPLNTLIPVFIQYSGKTVYDTEGIYGSIERIFNYQDKTLMVSYNSYSFGTVVLPAITVTLLQNSGSNLTVLNSFAIYTSGNITTVYFDGVSRFNDSTFGLEYWTYGGNGDIYLLPFEISGSQLIQYGDPDINHFNITSGQEFNQTNYICGLYDNTILIPDASIYTPTLFGLQIYDLTTKTLVNDTASETRGTSQNSGCYFNSTMYFSDDPPYIYATDVRDVNGYATAFANNALYSDTGYGTRQNLFIDTTRQLLFILYKTNLSTFSYKTTVGVAERQSARPQHSAGVTVIPGSASGGVTIVLHGFSGPAELSFYDMSGRIVDKMTGVTANAVRWRPKTQSTGCYIVSVANAREKSVARFVVR
ncbi:MAG: hypothetical protein ABSE00_03390 [Chitinispirillaceae bacterium]|jgi:hypothetical protein